MHARGWFFEDIVDISPSLGMKLPDNINFCPEGDSAMRIYIDADGCPVVDTAVSIARGKGIPVTIVKNHSHIIESDYATVITVDNSRDSADFYIANHSTKGDVVITQDNGLAAMCLAKGSLVINQNGVEITSDNIDAMLYSRHVHRELRQRGIYTSKSGKRSRDQDINFRIAFKRLLDKLING